MNYSKAFRRGYNDGCADVGKVVKELEARLASHKIYIATLEDRIKDTEQVLYSAYNGGGIPPWFGLKYDNCACRCEVNRREREFTFTKAELLQAIENLEKSKVT